MLLQVRLACPPCWPPLLAPLAGDAVRFCILCVCARCLYARCVVAQLLYVKPTYAGLREFLAVFRSDVDLEGDQGQTRLRLATRRSVVTCIPLSIIKRLCVCVVCFE
jgi:hypothetical protein